MENISKVTQVFILAFFCNNLVTSFSSGGISMCQVSAAVEEELRSYQQNKMKYYQDKLKKLNEEKDEMIKKEKSLINLGSRAAQWVAHMYVCPLLGMMSFAVSIPDKNDEDLNKADYDYDVRYFAMTRFVASMACDFTLKVLAEPYKEHKRHKKHLEKEIKKTLDKIEKLENSK